MASDFEDLETDTARTAIEPDARLHAFITVDGAVASRALPPGGTLTIGRAPDCDLVIPHGSVSRRHAVLTPSPLAIADLGSRNGTRVQGKPVVQERPTPIAIGDAIQIGEATIVIQSVPLSFDGKPLLAEASGQLPPVDAECARSARTGSPFAVLELETDGPPKQVLGLLRGLLRTTDVVIGDGDGGFQIVLVETGGPHVAIAATRITDLLAQNGIPARIGAARYPEDGVIPEQLVAHAYEQLAREPGGPATAMDGVRELVRQVAPGELSVLILGETGVGKELYAEMIHRLSPRAAKPFVKLNCSALVESLIETELFGHEKGSFTGATSAHPGLLETGDGGTVFLDEIGELTLPVQTKLLRVLEERVVRRIGSTSDRKIDVRFVFATNRSLADEVDAGRFRRDLYYRINGVTVALPPLRERTTEIVPLARAFASEARRGEPVTIGSEVAAALEHHSWPGNIRELRNTVERAVLLSSGGTIRARHLVLDATRDTPQSLRDSSPRMRDSRPTMPIPMGDTAPPVRPSQQSLASALADVEKQRILEALQQCGGNQSRAAKLLGISRTTLQARIDAYGLPRPRKS
ncbi:MAG: sigma 54-interacting transcriptional regulator [Deltaproteobacteria bacterium]|nr:sigma 54-interacting transcriptional regulator [Deltaproteobacteria bacterium]